MHKSKVWLALMVVFAIIAASAIAFLISSVFSKKQEAASYEELQELVNAVDSDITEINEVNGVDIPVKNLDWNELKTQNPDIYAWIYVPDANSVGIVDYPVLQHPEDNSYYLNHNLDGSTGYPGCLYTENYNSTDFSDPHTVIYGHNMNKGGMLTSLHDFEDATTFSCSDHYMYVYTENYTYVYKIWGAFEYSDIHLLDNMDFSNEYVMETFVNKAHGTYGRMFNICDDIDSLNFEHVLTLSTCAADHDSNYRFLVSGVLVNPKE